MTATQLREEVNRRANSLQHEVWLSLLNDYKKNYFDCYNYSTLNGYYTRLHKEKHRLKKMIEYQYWLYEYAYSFENNGKQKLQQAIDEINKSINIIDEKILIEKKHKSELKENFISEFLYKTV